MTPAIEGRPARTWLGRVALVVMSSLLALAAGELVLRVRVAWRPAAGLEALRGGAEFVAPQGRAVRLADLLRPSSWPGVVYELIPDVATVFLGKPLHVNEAGFRGPFYPVRKPPNTVRILGIGDSVMFGWGVGDEETYLARLSELLSRRHPGTRWEVINTAVPGYNAAIEAATLESRGLAYSPDLVLVGYVPNDFDLPEFMLNERNPLSLSESFLLEFLTGRLQGSLRRVDGLARLGGRTDPERVPESYRAMVGVDGYRAAMERIDGLRRRFGFEVIVFGYFDPDDDPAGTDAPGRDARDRQALEVARALGLPVVSAYERTARYLEEHGLDSPWPSELTVGAADAHPSAVWHEIFAETLLDDFESGGRAQALAARAERASPADPGFR